jgi:uncharacterized membrane protein YdfJ with MMPL/SSD domain
MQPSDQKSMKVTGTLVSHAGAIATGTALLLAAIRAEGHSTAIRAVLVIVGLAVIFRMLSFGFSGAIGTP